MSNHIEVLIVGAGTIAGEYVKVIEALGYHAIVVGRGLTRVKKLQQAYPNTKVVAGGLSNWLITNKPPKMAIISTPIDHLLDATVLLIKAGVKNILVEKPLTYSVDEAITLNEQATNAGANIYVAFNRRNYVSVIKAKQLIKEDGGVSSFRFDFTEAIFRIDPKNYSSQTTELWGIANSSHVIDTAFYLGGKPSIIDCRQHGNAIEWHPSGSIFTGLGTTEEGIPFTYHADWGCPGKWNIEILTSKRKLLFSPMEQLHQQLAGGFKTELVELDYTNDMNFKPGFYQQTKNLIEGKEAGMQLKELGEELTILNKIFNY
ncbi:Gfo/Idh/MocA family protein [Fulvivirga lutea]|uniref:Gfo/Idh/MocA family oxidoreductase n=1 Tax=Fulvivirga lutea TaxID=2810512 RepID=A0A974WGR6_9BACT|nr:Gfo/Idh/MocA family oxidoreductase [Fulvivirga lutea]QSE96812.1 Gfo/Idh/MocA family oxidoreductase [Fulvivirga lutea]